MSGRDDYMGADDVANVEEAVSKLRSSHEWLVRELETLKARYEKQVEYSNELFSESARRTGNLHRALGFDEDADFENDDVYFAKLKTIVEERDNHAANVAVLTSTLTNRPRLCPALEDSKTCQLPEGHVGEIHFDGSAGAWRQKQGDYAPSFKGTRIKGGLLLAPEPEGDSCCWCGNSERVLINSEDGLECDDKEACLVDIETAAKAKDPTP